MTDTHIYDGQIDRQLLPMLEVVKDLPIEEKKNRGLQIMEHVNNEIAQRFLMGIIDSMETPANYDPTNNLNADDLICLCWELRQNESFIENLIIQLIDMGTGFCPQGRTHRLFQILLAFYN